jgi:hypothetical protein
VALRARDVCVCSSQCETSGCVVELGTGPLYGRVTGLACRGESTRNVIRVPGGLEIRHVTGGAIGGGPGELAVHVALRASNIHVSAGQSELSQRIVIELRAGPLHGGMAALAGGREAGGSVIRIFRVPEIRNVA